jgi:hypothetical protein
MVGEDGSHLFSPRDGDDINDLRFRLHHLDIDEIGRAAYFLARLASYRGHDVWRSSPDLQTLDTEDISSSWIRIFTPIQI